VTQEFKELNLGNHQVIGKWNLHLTKSILDKIDENPTKDQTINMTKNDVTYVQHATDERNSTKWLIGDSIWKQDLKKLDSGKLSRYFNRLTYQEQGYLRYKENDNLTISNIADIYVIQSFSNKDPQTLSDLYLNDSSELAELANVRVQEQILTKTVTQVRLKHHYEERKDHTLHVIDDSVEVTFNCTQKIKGIVLPFKRVVGKREPFIPYISNQDARSIILTINPRELQAYYAYQIQVIFDIQKQGNFSSNYTNENITSIRSHLDLIRQIQNQINLHTQWSYKEITHDDHRETLAFMHNMDLISVTYTSTMSMVNPQTRVVERYNPFRNIHTISFVYEEILCLFT